MPLRCVPELLRSSAAAKSTTTRSGRVVGTDTASGSAMIAVALRSLLASAATAR